MESAIIADIANIKDDIKEIKGMVSESNKGIKEVIASHMKGCRAHGFFENEGYYQKLMDTLYAVEFKAKEDARKQVFFRWLFSLPVAGLVIDRLVSILFTKHN